MKYTLKCLFSRGDPVSVNRVNSVIKVGAKRPSEKVRTDMTPFDGMEEVVLLKNSFPLIKRTEQIQF